eukprot:g2746.t1
MLDWNVSTVSAASAQSFDYQAQVAYEQSISSLILSQELVIRKECNRALRKYHCGLVFPKCVTGTPNSLAGPCYDVGKAYCQACHVPLGCPISHLPYYVNGTENCLTSTDFCGASEVNCTWDALNFPSSSSNSAAFGRSYGILILSFMMATTLVLV